MDPKVLKTIVQQIHRRFPEFAGIQPKVRQQISTQPKDFQTKLTYLLTFQKKVVVAESKSIPRWVRVVIDEQGKILKLTTSR